MAASTIKEFLVNFGYKLDQASQRRLTDSFILIANQAQQLALTIKNSVLEAVGSFAKVAEGMERLYYLGQRSHSTVEDIKRITYAVSQMGGSSEGARNAIEGLTSFIRDMPNGQGFIENLTGKKFTGAADALLDIGAKLGTMSTQMQHQYGQLLHIDDMTLQALIRNSYRGSQEFTDAVKRIGVDLNTASEHSVSFMQRLRAVGSTIGLFYDKIVGDISPKLSQQLEMFRQFMLDHATEIIKIVERIIRFWLDMGQAAIQLGKRIFELVSGIIDWWDKLDVKTKAVFEAIGIAWLALNLKFLKSPIGIIIALGLALLALWDDYETWKEGGKSLIDWSKWDPDIQKALKYIKDLWVLIDGFVQHIGGWQHVLEGFAIFMAVRWALGIAGALSTVTTAITGSTVAWIARIATFMAAPEVVAFLAFMAMMWPKSTQTQEQENAILGRPPDAGSFGGVPGGPQQTPGKFHDENNIAPEPLGQGIGGEKLSGLPGGFLGSSANWMHRNLPGAFGGQSGVKSELAQKMVAFFKSMGWSAAQAAGMVANIYAESSGNPGAQNGAHFGIGQWDEARQMNFARLFGHRMDDPGLDYQQRLEEELRFFDWELRHPDSGSGQQAVEGLNRATTPEAATEAVLHSERPANPGTAAWDKEMENRSGLARQISLGSTAPPGGSEGASGANVSMSQQNSITIHGATNPNTTAQVIGQELDRHSADLLRAGKGALA